MHSHTSPLFCPQCKSITKVSQVSILNMLNKTLALQERYYSHSLLTVLTVEKFNRCFQTLEIHFSLCLQLETVYNERYSLCLHSFSFDSYVE